MSYALGIDIGTSFVAASVARQTSGHATPPQSLHLGARAASVPSVVFVGADGQVLVGDAAERRGTAAPDRVVREFKRRIGDPVPVMVGDLAVAPEDILATIARWVVDRAGEQEGAPPDAIAVAHPAGWGPYKLSLVRQALAAVGLADAELINEPQAAALHYASQERVDTGATIAVYDLGGGTFDVALLRKTGPDAFEILGRPDGIERLGGADFDEAVLTHVAASVGEPLARLDPTDPDDRLALTRLRRECTEAKEALSDDVEASVPVLVPGAQGQVRIVRAELEAMIGPAVRETVGMLRHALDTAELDPEDLSTILLIGGSSRIPLVAQVLSEELGRPIAIDADPKASISLGAALAAAAPLAAAAEASQAPTLVAVPGGQVAADGDGHDAPAAPDVEVAAFARGRTTFEMPQQPDHPGRRAGRRVAAVAAVVVGLTLGTAVAGEAPTAIQEALDRTFPLKELRQGAPGAAAAQAPTSDETTGSSKRTSGAAEREDRTKEAEDPTTDAPQSTGTPQEASADGDLAPSGPATGQLTDGATANGGTPTTKPSSPSAGPTTEPPTTPPPTTDPPTPTPEATPTPSPEPTPEPTPTPSPEPTPEPTHTIDQPPAEQTPPPDGGGGATGEPTGGTSTAPSEDGATTSSDGAAG
ncbi:Hsp70 family protein [Georgenia sp. AZ-5]|uniref:Hsp70 family protein n=1 Tax=Georgenia sp. AZ-5 TaxID=3367526 RepID=UPI0037550FFC